MFEITRSYEISAAHRIPGHPKCGRFHGHNYTIEVTLMSEELNLAGMIMDFGELDEYLRPILNRYDHRYLATVHEEPEKTPTFIDMGRDSVYLGAQWSTAEAIARVLYWQFRTRLGGDAYPYKLKCVRVWETPRSSATYYPTGNDGTTKDEWPASSRYTTGGLDVPRAKKGREGQ